LSFGLVKQTQPLKTACSVNQFV